MLDAFRRRSAHARQCNQLFIAGLISPETIASIFGSATAILDSARVYNMAVTLWTFLTQLLGADHGCVYAVTRLVAYRLANGQSAPSSKTGAYCTARDKLDESAMHRPRPARRSSARRRTNGGSGIG